jgi:hypothetical protein
MPISPTSYSTASGPNLQNQVLQNVSVQPYVNQQNYGQVIGEILSANPDMDPSLVAVKVNSIARKIYDRRTWSSMFVRGQIITAPYVTGGNVTVTLGSNYVVGSGTNWTTDVIGRQFRVGYNTPQYTITELNVATQTITLEMPWGGQSITASGYFIAQYYYSPGPNIKYIHTARNMIMAWRLRLDYTQQSLDTIDPWRINTFSPVALAQMPRDTSGNYMVELWPVPSFVQALPFIAYVQPPNLVDDTDNFPAAIRTDIVAKFGIAEAKVHGGPKMNKYYDAMDANRLRQEAEMELNYLAKADEDLYRQSMLYDWESVRMAPEPGLDSNWSINHGVQARSGGWDW